MNFGKCEQNQVWLNLYPQLRLRSTWGEMVNCACEQPSALCTNLWGSLDIWIQTTIFCYCSIPEITNWLFFVVFFLTNWLDPQYATEHPDNSWSCAKMCETSFSSQTWQPWLPFFFFSGTFPLWLLLLCLTSTDPCDIYCINLCNMSSFG